MTNTTNSPISHADIVRFAEERVNLPRDIWKKIRQIGTRTTPGQAST
jgi:hypothetical protein